MNLGEAARTQIEALQQAKSRRTPVEKKLSSRLVRASSSSSDPTPLLSLRDGLQQDRSGRTLIDIEATITGGLATAVKAHGGEILNSFPEYRAMRAWVPLAAIQPLASRSDVSFIKPAVKARAHAGKVVSEGDIAHGAAQARTDFGINGAGVKVGVLSDNLQYLAASKANGELGNISVLTGQAGTGKGEGTAMLEIIHDLAPGASLYFATAMSSPASFARNIKNLRAAGCDIIVDDVGYYDESPFQDGIIAQAVNTVTENGALYFSAAGNSGSKAAGTSSTWEGNFVSSGTISYGSIHSFGPATYNQILRTTYQNYAALFWTDPLGASKNDYDLYVLDSTGQQVVAGSDDYQGGAQDPYELVDSINAGERVIVVLSAGSPRFLHLDTGGAPLTISTTGSTRGHNSASNAFCVAAIDASANKTFVADGTNPEENFSSDGPRRIFFNPNGTALTPGNFLADGGVLRNKPDLAAADGVRTSVPGFNPFYGTSAAAPHAAALAALLKSAQPQLTPGELRHALTTGTLDNDTTGWDPNSGYGISMAGLALEKVVPSTSPTVQAPIVPARLSVRTLADSSRVELQIEAAAGQVCTVEVSENLAGWTTLTTVTNLLGATVVQDRVPASNSHRFYRVTTFPGAKS